MKDDIRDVRVTTDMTLARVLERARKLGELRLLDGDDVFVLKHRGSALPDSARDFLLRGGPVED